MSNPNESRAERRAREEEVAETRHRMGMEKLDQLLDVLRSIQGGQRDATAPAPSQEDAPRRAHPLDFAVNGRLGSASGPHLTTRGIEPALTAIGPDGPVVENREVAVRLTEGGAVRAIVRCTGRGIKNPWSVSFMRDSGWWDHRAERDRAAAEQPALVESARITLLGAQEEQAATEFVRGLEVTGYPTLNAAVAVACQGAATLDSWVKDQTSGVVALRDAAEALVKERAA